MAYDVRVRSWRPSHTVRSGVDNPLSVTLCVKSTRISSHSPGVVSVIKGAMPDRSEEEIREAYRGALGGWMKSEATVDAGRWRDK